MNLWSIIPFLPWKIDRQTHRFVGFFLFFFCRDASAAGGVHRVGAVVARHGRHLPARGAAQRPGRRLPTRRRRLRLGRLLRRHWSARGPHSSNFAIGDPLVDSVSKADSFLLFCCCCCRFFLRSKERRGRRTRPSCCTRASDWWPWPKRGGCRPSTWCTPTSATRPACSASRPRAAAWASPASRCDGGNSARRSLSSFRICEVLLRWEPCPRWSCRPRVDCAGDPSGADRDGPGGVHAEPRARRLGASVGRRLRAAPGDGRRRLHLPRPHGRPAAAPPGSSSLHVLFHLFFRSSFIFQSSFIVNTPDASMYSMNHLD